MRLRGEYQDAQSTLTVIDIVQVSMRIFWIVYDERPTQAIAILNPLVTMIPKCS